MSKAFWRELGSQLLGETTIADAVRSSLSTDGSPYRLVPEGVVYPRNTADVRKLVCLLVTRAESGKFACLTPRGFGTGQVGGALSEGIQVVTTGYMNRLLRLDKHTATVQPGLSWSALQHVLRSHNRSLPLYGLDEATGTIGGTIASGTLGSHSVKYGPLYQWVRGLRVVLSDGSIIETRRLSARELHHKKGLNSLEGQLYRALDGLLLDHPSLAVSQSPVAAIDTTGYSLTHIRRPDGSFDLTPVFIGSEGTLGVITEITLRTAASSVAATTLVVGACDDIHQAAELIAKLAKDHRPSTLELVDRTGLELLRRIRPQELAALPVQELPAILIFAEFDDATHLLQTMRYRRAERLFARSGRHLRTATDPIAQIALWNVRYGLAHATQLIEGAKRPVPGLHHLGIAPDQLGPFLTRLHRLLARQDIEAPVWGSAGSGQLEVWPLLDLTKKRDRDRYAVLMEGVAELIREFKGALSTGGNGIALAALVESVLGASTTDLHRQVKRIFDPHAIFNPGKKLGPAPDLAEHFHNEYRPSWPAP